MAKDGDNGRIKRIRAAQGTGNRSRAPRESLSTKFFDDRMSEFAKADSCTLEEAFRAEDAGTVLRFRSMYAKSATVHALEDLGINIHWELRNYQEIARNPKTTPAIKMDALAKIQAIRSTVHDCRVAPTGKRTPLTPKAEKNVDPFMQIEADGAGEQWTPSKEEGG